MSHYGLAFTLDVVEGDSSRPIIPKMPLFLREADTYLVQCGERGITEKLPPHITVKYDLDLDSTGAGHLVRYLQGLHLGAIEAEIHRLEVFREPGSIYFVVEGDAFLTHWQHLIDALASIGHARTGWEGETPHITITKGVRVEYTRLLQMRRDIANLSWRPWGAFTLTDLVLYELTNDGPLWHQGQRIALV